MKKQTKLEDSILKKVYVFETKKTAEYVILRIATFFLLGFIAFTFGVAVYEILQEQKTFELFEIFEENFEVIRRYAGDVFITVFQEIPKTHALIFCLVIIALLVFIWRVVRKFGLVKNKIQSLVHYWHSQ